VLRTKATLEESYSNHCVSLPGRAAMWISRLDRLGMAALRFGLIVVLLWIGALKFASYEADSIVPLVANSPALRVLYRFPSPAYRQYMNREGELVPAHRAWHQSNRTYPVSSGLGVTIVILGILLACHPISPGSATVGSLLVVLMSCTTLSFLVTTPEAWVPALGDAAHGFPFLSGVGRLILKDIIMLGAGVATAADSARAYVRRHYRPIPC
jgi:uncharacterized membrane protein YkgB